MVQVQYCLNNHEGLGLQDEYLRSDGVGRDFLKIDAGGSLHPTLKNGGREPT
jgi:hypothetical protein